MKVSPTNGNLPPVNLSYDTPQHSFNDYDRFIQNTKNDVFSLRIYRCFCFYVAINSFLFPQYDKMSRLINAALEKAVNLKVFAEFQITNLYVTFLFRHERH